MKLGNIYEKRMIMCYGDNGIRYTKWIHPQGYESWSYYDSEMGRDRSVRNRGLRNQLNRALTKALAEKQQVEPA